MNIFRTIIYSFTIILFISSCHSNEKPIDFDYGKIENNVYSNTFFKFKINVPSDWAVQSKEQTDAIAEQGQNLVAGDDENMKAVLKASEVNTANLLVVFKYPVGSTVEYNPSFMLVAENIARAPGIKTGGDYLSLTRNLLKQAQVQYTHIDDSFATEKIGNKEFHRMNTDIEMAGQSIHQRYYATLVNGFSFVVIISYNSEEQLKELLSVLNAAKFE